MTIIQTGQQNGEVLEFKKRAKSGNFVRKKSGQRCAIDEEAFVVFLSCCLCFVSGRGRLLEHSKKNDVTVCVLFRGIYHISERNERFIYKFGGKTGGIVSIRIASTLVRNIKVESSCLCHNLSTVDDEVSPTARALLSLPGLRPAFQKMLR